jgi:hypothetical protein
MDLVQGRNGNVTLAINGQCRFYQGRLDEIAHIVQGIK